MGDESEVLCGSRGHREKGAVLGAAPGARSSVWGDEGSSQPLPEKASLILWLARYLFSMLCICRLREVKLARRSVTSSTCGVCEGEYGRLLEPGEWSWSLLPAVAASRDCGNHPRFAPPRVVCGCLHPSLRVSPAHLLSGAGHLQARAEVVQLVPLFVPPQAG